MKVDEQSVECFRFGKKIPDNANKEFCIYHIDIKFEDGEAMTLLQQLLLKEQELKSRKMTGVI